MVTFRDRRKNITTSLFFGSSWARTAVGEGLAPPAFIVVRPTPYSAKKSLRFHGGMNCLFGLFERHISVFYKSGLSEYLVDYKRKNCGENEANKHKTYPIERRYL